MDDDKKKKGWIDVPKPSNVKEYECRGKAGTMKLNSFTFHVACEVYREKTGKLPVSLKCNGETKKVLGQCWFCGAAIIEDIDDLETWEGNTYHSNHLEMAQIRAAQSI